VIEIAHRIEQQFENNDYGIDDSMLQNIDLLIQCLRSSYEAYQDFTMPAVQWLQCVWLGLVLFKQSTKDKLDDKKSPSTWNMLRAVASARNTGHLSGTAASLEGMQFVALAHKIGNEQTLMPYVWDFFEDIYLTWKDKMSEEQAKQAKKSSLYIYRGDQEEQYEIDEKEYDVLFPEFSDANASSHTKGTEALARDTAIQIATVHGQLFCPKFDSVEYLLKLVKSGRPTDMACALPTIFLAMQEKLNIVNATKTEKDNYNIYQDANVPEVTRLVTLLGKILRRFEELQVMDFEHSTVDDVVRLATELLAFPHTEPIAKYLTKVEKLYESMYEWERVAHKGLSAAKYLAELTDLIVSWRRLELSTWMQLFAIEQQKAEDDAKSWWFVAYENIVANPRRLSSEDIALHTPELVQALESFFNTATLGQFHQRLQILVQFKEHLAASKASFPELEPIYDALSNFLAYYSRFRQPITDALETQRQQLEKQAKEVVQLASWKDTNIESLRQSAKTSHRKLFKLVRKFRALLDTPVASIIERGPPDNSETINASGSKFTVPAIQGLALSSASMVCQQLPNWNDVPLRFRNINATVELMGTFGTIPKRIDSVGHVYEFLDSLLESIIELQKATPSLLTEENKDNVRHLKTRKRALFADVLKKIRHMGFQYNLSSNVLAKQSSTAIILASLPTIEITPQLEAAEYHFHKVLDLMPRVRDIQHKYSGDLTSAEVQRSVGYLDGILHQILQQRRMLIPVLASTAQIDAYTAHLAQLWDDKASSPAKLLQISSKTFREFKRQVAWLEPVLRALNKVLAIQTQLGVLNGDTIRHGLERAVESIKQLLTDLNDIPDLPASLHIENQEQIDLRATTLLQGLRNEVASWINQQPTFAPVLQLLEPWIDFSEIRNSRAEPCNLSLDQSASLSSIQSKVLGALDTILGSVQALNGTWDNIPQPAERQGWLMDHVNGFTVNLKALNPHAVNDRVQQCFEVLAVVPKADQSTCIAFLTLLQPFMARYCAILNEHVSRFSDFHAAHCKLAYSLSKSFLEIGTNGFCTPPEKTTGEGESGQEQKLEGGTGLGEGKGAEDISKDVGDDEDLTELAQEPDQKKDGEEIEDERDAVDMADEDLEGQLGEKAEKEESGEDQVSGDEQENEPDEEMGLVDDLGPETVDEKMWDEGGADDNQEKQADKSKGKQNDEQMAAEGDKKERTVDEEEEKEEDAEAGAQEDEAVGQQQGEQVDDFTEQAEKLDLPEDMNLDGSMGDKSDDESMDDLDLEDERLVEEIDMRDATEEAQEDAEADAIERPTDSEPDVETEDAEENNIAEEEKDAGEDGSEKIESPETGNVLQGQERDAKTAADAVPSEVQGMGADADDQDNEQSAFNSRTKQDQGEQGNETKDAGGGSCEQGDNLDTDRQDAVGRGEDLADAAENQPFKKLGDTLEKWFNQRRQIKQATENTEEPIRENKKDVEMADADFEHLLNEESQAEAQALGAATEDQARALDEENAVATNEEDLPAKSFVDDEDEPDAGYQTADDVHMDDAREVSDAQPPDEAKQGQAKAFIGDSKMQDYDEQLADGQEASPELIDNEVQPLPSPDNISDGLQAVSISNADGRALWMQKELKTRTLAAILTEQLRLILAPTMATKLRGDFRTGKRLNIKRIIPYIASSYKRDKIWMRRSVPSKRAYQIMIAVDDSKSMAENGKKELAFETLALVTKALSMLEVGELCVAGFGENVHVAHPFDKPFTDDAGVEIFSKLAFEQGDTDVRKLVSEGISLFQDARAKASSSVQDLWQLMIVVSDAICRDSESIKRLVRKAQDEKIMIVFVVIDAGAKEVDGRQVGSIMDLQGAEFKDGQVKMYRYMDVFPFKWWVVVRDVRELPGVLSVALRQWFAEVVDTGA
jgi:midasin